MMEVRTFDCDAGRDFIKISIDLWDDFKLFYNEVIRSKVDVRFVINYKYLNVNELNIGRDDVLNNFLHLQLEILISVIRKKEELLKQHELLIDLKSSLNEFELVKLLLGGNKRQIVLDYHAFIINQIIPIYNLKIKKYEEILKINYNKNFVRQRPEEFALVKLETGFMKDDLKAQVIKYLNSVIRNEKEYIQFSTEFFDGRVNEMVYSINITTLKEFCRFFKFLCNEDYLNVEKKALASWIIRKFKIEGDSGNLGKEGTIIKYLEGVKHDPFF
ncbi:hypothetical protein [Pedobacter jejuensis]|uniref:Uncharacterized protein n=1 Tax=Pedobacter jejuensis TaxID=1268550 RepID=A0A3N0C1Z7_9SPHI|nr:hypothetical protein [Pedobacter jejuensis]RNL56436.1 hypothetical protein D7004_00680 [Pedobacter jejuensis]